MTRLDLRHLHCPMPALRTRKALLGCVSGETLLVICTDPLTEIDIPDLVRQMGDELCSMTVQGEERHFLIRRA